MRNTGVIVQDVIVNLVYPTQARDPNNQSLGRRMAIPDYQTLMLRVLRRAALGAIRVPDVEQHIADEFGLTPEERDQVLPSGRQKVLHNRIHWSKFYIAKAGLIDQPSRGVFTASQLGRHLLQESPARIDVSTLPGYSAFEEFYRRSGGGAGKPSSRVADVGLPTVSEQTPEEQIEAAYQALHSALREDLFQRILQNTPGFFEQVIVDLLVAMGYGGSHRDAAAQLGRSGDGGVDGVISVKLPPVIDSVAVAAV